ncbi:dihydrofolate reductase family protein [Microbacterium sp. NPDC019599]|uniref:dihydrofolate reductase family protein n=1 Tax=Microbacterium sp. NPDC019599 TaxID=3154690 RepID=UPI0033D28826
MGRLSYGMLLSLDGFIAEEGGDITLPVPEAELHRHFNDVMRRTALSIYGRRMWEVMQYWGEPDPDRDAVGEEFAALWQETPKVVVSTTLTEVPPGVTLIRDDAVEAVRRIKAETEGDIDVSGAQLAAAVGAAGLIDEYLLYVQPVVLGTGRPYFAAGFRPDLALVGSEQLPQGVVLLRYAPA